MSKDGTSVPLRPSHDSSVWVDEAPGHGANSVEEIQGGVCFSAMHGTGTAEKIEVDCHLLRGSIGDPVVVEAVPSGTTRALREAGRYRRWRSDDLIGDGSEGGRERHPSETAMPPRLSCQPGGDQRQRTQIRITGLRRKPGGQGGLPPRRGTDDRRLGSAIATLRIDSVESTVWCGRVARNDDFVGPINVEGWHVRPSAPMTETDADPDHRPSGSASRWAAAQRRPSAADVQRLGSAVAPLPLCRAG
jgi:hypothetical protein